MASPITPKCICPTHDTTQPKQAKTISDINQKLKICARCRIATYCSRECQTAHWATHKLVCLSSEKTNTPEPSIHSLKLKTGFFSLANFLLGSRSVIFAAPRCPTSLTDDDKQSIATLISLPLDSNEFNKRGQELFDFYKTLHNGNSMLAKAAVQRICDAIYHEAGDGKERYGRIELAWNGIGDSTWKWQA